MAERVAHKLQRRVFTAQRLRASRRQQHRHGVEHHRRCARQLPVHRHQRAVGKRHAAHLGRHDLDAGARSQRRLADSRQRLAVRPVVQQDADAAPGQRVLHLADDLQCWRRLKVLHRGRSSRRRRQLLQRQAGSHALRQTGIDVQQVRHHRLAHMGRAHLRQFEHESRRDVRLLMHRLAAKELARLAVVVGKTGGAHAALGATFISRE